MKAYWVIGIAMAAGLEGRVEECTVDVHIINNSTNWERALVPAAALRASDMFRQIGVPIRMRHGSPAREAASLCGTLIVVEIENESNYSGSQNALAYAMPFKKSGTSIHVFLDRIVRMGDRTDFVIASLAHVMVHEITHVLQRVERHSATGIMRANWSNQDYQRIVRGPLPFSPRDVELIRDGLAKRFPRAVWPQ